MATKKNHIRIILGLVLCCTLSILTCNNSYAEYEDMGDEKLYKQCVKEANERFPVHQEQGANVYSNIYDIGRNYTGAGTEDVGDVDWACRRYSNGKGNSGVLWMTGEQGYKIENGKYTIYANVRAERTGKIKAALVGAVMNETYPSYAVYATGVQICDSVFPKKTKTQVLPPKNVKCWGDIGITPVTNKSTQINSTSQLFGGESYWTNVEGWRYNVSAPLGKTITDQVPYGNAKNTGWANCHVYCFLRSTKEMESLTKSYPYIWTPARKALIEVDMDKFMKTMGDKVKYDKEHDYTYAELYLWRGFNGSETSYGGTPIRFIIQSGENTARVIAYGTGSDGTNNCSQSTKNYTKVTIGEHNNTTVDVKGNQACVAFRAELWRDDVASETIKAGYLINSGKSEFVAKADSNYKFWNSPYSYISVNIKKDETKTIKLNGDKWLKEDINPGEIKNYWVTLGYTKPYDNNNKTKPTYLDTTCEYRDKNGNITNTVSGRACINLHRPLAAFKGSNNVYLDGKLASKVTGIRSKTEKATDSNGALHTYTKYTLIVQPGSTYKVDFFDEIRREKNGDNAGGTANTKYCYSDVVEGANNASLSDDLVTVDASHCGITKAMDSTTGTSATVQADTNSAQMVNRKGNKDESKHSKQVTISLSESVTVCQQFVYLNERDFNRNKSAATFNDATKTSSWDEGGKYRVYDKRCVTLQTEDVDISDECFTDNAAFEYDDDKGRTVARIGVQNMSTQTSVADFSNTGFSTATVEDNTFKSVSIWAKPGDNIRFRHQMCAGVIRPLTKRKNEVWHEKDTPYPNIKKVTLEQRDPTFTVEGKILKNNGATAIKTSAAGKTSYLFGSQLTNVGRFNQSNPVTMSWSDLPNKYWATQYNVSKKFMNGIDDAHLNATLYSPTPSVDSFTCVNGTAHMKGFYQVRGVLGETGSPCVPDLVAPSKVNDVDVGGEIVQRISWADYAVETYATQDCHKYRQYHETTDSEGNVTDYWYTTERSCSNVTKWRSQYYGTKTSEAHVRIPYNYVSKPYATNKTEAGSGIVYLGNNATFEVGAVTQGRVNDLINNKQKYATITKQTTISEKAFYVHAGETLDQKHYIKVSDGTATYNEKTQTKRLNRTGSLSGSTESIDQNIMVPVPANGDIKVGDRVCIEVSISPADSHEAMSNTKVYGARKANLQSEPEYALSESGSTKATTISCSTVVKRPTMSVESSNAYSAAGYNTSFYSRFYTYDAVPTKYFFGSWSEYGAFGKVATNFLDTYASGAALGYKTNGTTGSGLNATRTNTTTDEVARVDNAEGNVCNFMTQTFANKNCNTSDTLIGGESASSYRKRIIQQFGGLGDAVAGTTTYNGGTYVNLNNASSDFSKVSGNAYISSSRTPSSGNTVVYNVGGTLIIDGNINDIRGTAYSKPSQIPNVVIIANNVWVTNNVSYINAIIVTKSDSGELNTCKYDGSTLIENVKKLNSKTCNNELIFDAPVVVGKLILNRTYGAEAGNDSIKRAEIFNLNMANYLWSYDKMSNYDQATTTYSRELPTRY